MDNDCNWIPKPPSLPSINIICRLRYRELGCRRSGSEWVQGCRDFYWSIYPRISVVNVDKPECFLRKFTPSGRRLLAFSSTQTSIVIYEFLGVPKAGNLMSGVDDDVLLAEEDGAEFGSSDARRQLFDTLFRLEHTVPLLESISSTQLNRECSLFTPDSRHVLVASQGPCSQLDERRFPGLLDLYRNNESLSPNGNAPLEDINLFCVDLSQGRLCDRQYFPCDRIVLSHNQGVHLCGRLLAVLSVQHQTIHLFQVDSESGMLIRLQRIGRFLFDDDQMFLQPSLTADPDILPETAVRFAPLVEQVMTGIKHRVIGWLYRRARMEGQLQRFFQSFDHFRNLRMWKMQMVDSDRFLIRFVSENTVSMKVDPNVQPSWYVLFDWKTSQVLNVYDCYSKRLLEMYEHCADQFRHPDGNVTFPCSINTCNEARNAHRRYKRMLDNAKDGCETETVRRVLSQLPFGAQNLACTPYLDPSLFSYDDKLLSQSERSRVISESCVRFFSRRTSRLTFQMHCGLGNPVANARHLSAFIFHPTDPFAISLHRSAYRLEYTANFHLPAGPINK